MYEAVNVVRVLWSMVHIRKEERRRDKGKIHCPSRHASLASVSSYELSATVS